MVRDTLARPPMGVAASALQSKMPWLVGLALIAGAAVAVGSALYPLEALVALPLLVLVACIWKWPALAAYLVIGLTPLTAGVGRGAAIPLLRPQEVIALFVGVALLMRVVAGLRAGQVPGLRLDRVEWSMLLLAICSSVVPLLVLALNRQPVTQDDLLYALVLWKYFGLYVLIRMSVRSDQEIGRSLWIAVGAASVVAVLAILQSLELFGIPRLLATWYPPFGFTAGEFTARGSSTLALPAATADLMIYNLAIVAGFWWRSRGHRALLAPIALLLVLAALSAGEFSSAIGVVVAVVCIALVTSSARLLALFVPTGLVASLLLQPVFAARINGFQSVSGLPVSWTVRLQNLQNYFWPQLFSGWHFLLGVRPAARIPVASQAGGFVWIESGYTWLLWGGGIPLLASFVFFVLAIAKRGWDVARNDLGAAGVAGLASFVAVIVTAVLMIFDPHLTYRGSADLMFVLIALATSRYRRPSTARTRITAAYPAEEVRP